jgi:hypothetical protein
MDNLHEDVFTYMLPRGILRGMIKVSVTSFVDNQNTYVFQVQTFSRNQIYHVTMCKIMVQSERL